MIRWHQTLEFSDLVAYYEGLIRLRKKLPGLCDKSADAIKRISGKKVWREGVVSFCVDNMDQDGESKWSSLFIAYNNNTQSVHVDLPKGTWTVLADKDDSDCEKLPTFTTDGQLIIEGCSGIIIGK